MISRFAYMENIACVQHAFIKMIALTVRIADQIISRFMTFGHAVSTCGKRICGKEQTMARMDIVKKIIKDRYQHADCGLFFTRNVVGDPMTTIWDEDGVTIDICYRYSYFEVFGLTGEEENELSRFYDSLKRSRR